MSEPTVLCRACSETLSQPLLDCYQLGCTSCQARAIAVVGDRVLLLQDPLEPAWRAILERIFGAAWREQVPEVRRWVGVIRRFEASNVPA